MTTFVFKTHGAAGNSFSRIISAWLISWRHQLMHTSVCLFVLQLHLQVICSSDGARSSPVRIKHEPVRINRINLINDRSASFVYCTDWRLYCFYLSYKRGIVIICYVLLSSLIWNSKEKDHRIMPPVFYTFIIRRGLYNASNFFSAYWKSMSKCELPNYLFFRFTL